MQWRYTGDAMAVSFDNGDKALINNLYRLKIQYSEKNGRMLENKLQQEKSGNVINSDLKNIQHRPKAWDWQTEAYMYWKERDHCGFYRRLAKPQWPV